MSRPARILSENGLYHIVFRGINRQNLFEEEADYEKLLEIVEKIKTESKIQIYAYCLMTNHVHLFVKEQNTGDIKSVMHRLLTTYVMWYNKKYLRSGSLIGNRYKSEPIEDEQYYLALIRYIHQNPVRAGIVEKIEDYKWSSYNEYLNGEKLADINFALSMLSADINKSIEKFQEFHKNAEDINFTITNTKKLTDEQLKRKLLKMTGGIRAEEISAKPKVERDMILALLRKKGFTIGQLERVTGISRGIVSRANNNV